MKRQTRSEQIQNAIDTTLSGLKDDPRLAQRIITEAKGEKEDISRICIHFCVDDDCRNSFSCDDDSRDCSNDGED